MVPNSFSTINGSDKMADKLTIDTIRDRDQETLIGLITTIQSSKDLSPGIKAELVRAIAEILAEL